ncbi:MAG: RNA polymerase sigma factor [Oscillospiraceae bacterium]|nr:RNA polymerase sigma factor [Oscillospiraceae bacterium]
MQDFSGVYEQYYTDVFRFLRGLTADELLAEELTQETFFRAMKAMDDFDGRCELRVWLCQIGKNLWYSHCRSAKHLSPLEEADHVPDEVHIAELIADKALALHIHKLLHTMREPYKEIFTLRVFGELSFREIGDVFGKSEHWACVSYHRAKAMLQRLLKEEQI